MGRLWASARVFTGDAVILCPRPEGRSGCVQTATTSCPSARHLCRVGTAAAGVPMKTIRIFGGLTCQRFGFGWEVDKRRPQVLISLHNLFRECLHSGGVKCL